MTEEWIKKMWCIHTMEYYLAIKKNEIMPFAATWMDPRECHTKGSKSDREGEISHDIPYMWNLKRDDTNVLTAKTERRRLKKTNLWLSVGKG